MSAQSLRDGQYFHYLAIWLFALHVLGRTKPAYREKAIALARSIPSTATSSID